MIQVLVTEARITSSHVPRLLPLTEVGAPSITVELPPLSRSAEIDVVTITSLVPNVEDAPPPRVGSPTFGVGAGVWGLTTFMVTPFPLASTTTPSDTLMAYGTAVSPADGWPPSLPQTRFQVSAEEATDIGPRIVGSAIPRMAPRVVFPVES